MSPSRPWAQPPWPIGDRGQPALTLEVAGRPATFATASEAPWKQAIRDAADAANAQYVAGRLSLRIEFRLPEPHRAGQGWDLDNLLKPTIDALEAVLGLRRQQGRPQSDDERIDHIDAIKRPAAGGAVGATIEVWTLTGYGAGPKASP